MAAGNAGVATRLQPQATTTNPFQTFLRRYFFFGMSLVMAAVIVAGFSRTVEHNLFHAAPPRPMLLWAHGVAFSLWLLVFAVQSALVSVRKVSVHRLLGWFGAALALAMVVLGVTVNIVMTRFDITVLHQQGANVFMSIPFADMLIFGTLVGLAIYWRRRTDLHRRLMFIASCELMDAGIGRFDFWFNHSIFYVFVDALIVVGMLRDWKVDGRVHKVYFYALPAMIFIQALAVYMWRANPGWYEAMTHAILGV